MITTVSSRPWLKVAGSLLTVASLCSIVILLWPQGPVLLSFRPSFYVIVVVVLSSVAYAAAGLLLAKAWRSLLLWCAEDNVRPDESRQIYAGTQLAKYLPGNVAQLMGRYLMGRQAGWSHVGLLISSVFELVSLLCVGAAITVIGLAETGRQIGIITIPLLMGLAAGLIGTAFLLLRFGPGLLVRFQPEFAERLAKCRISALWPVVLFHAGFFVIGGLILLSLSQALLKSGVDPGSWPALLSLFAIAWTAGVITPGSPSGLGVREAVLVLGLSAMMSTGQAALVAGLLRVVTVGGDLFFFVFGGARRLRVSQHD
jgi:uncharacterized membrane protein YbhN (UPF0104 family)